MVTTDLSLSEQQALIEIRHAFKDVEGAPERDLDFIRFLRARKFNVKKATEMLEKSIVCPLETIPVKFTVSRNGGWRTRLICCMRVYFRTLSKQVWSHLIGEFSLIWAPRVGAAYLHGRDKGGRPCIVLRTALHDPKTRVLEEHMKFSIWMIERAIKWWAFSFFF